MLAKNQTLTVLGCGTMGEAIVRGILRSGRLEPAQIFATDRRAEVAKSLREKHGIRTTSDNREACRAGDVVLVCVKPHEVGPLLRDAETAKLLAGKLVISIAAGIRLDQLAGWLPQSAVVRAMPNTPCLIGEGMTVIARGAGVTDDQAKVAHGDLRLRGRLPRSRGQDDGRGHQPERQRPRVRVHRAGSAVRRRRSHGAPARHGDADRRADVARRRPHGAADRPAPGGAERSGHDAGRAAPSRGS